MAGFELGITEPFNFRIGILTCNSTAYIVLKDENHSLFVQNSHVTCLSLKRQVWHYSLANSDETLLFPFSSMGIVVFPDYIHVWFYYYQYNTVGNRIYYSIVDSRR